MINLKIAGAAAVALLVIAPVLASTSADARPGGRGGGGGFHGGGGGFRGGGVGLAGRPGIGVGRPGIGVGRPGIGVAGGRYWNGRRWIAPGIGLATGLAAGAAFGSPYYDYGYGPYAYYGGGGYGDTTAYCQQRYRSYDPSSGTYLGRDGLRHPCP